MSRLVAVVLHESVAGGASNAVLRPLPELERDGWRFCFWAPRPSPVAALLEKRGYTVAGEQRPFRYSLTALRERPGPLARLRAAPGYLRRFRGFIRQAGPDLVHANTILTLPEAVVAHACGRPTMLHVHEMLPAGPRGAAAAQLARIVDSVATVSEACAAPWGRHGIDVQVVTAGIAAGPAVDRDVRRRPLVVGTLGTVCKRKGSDLFVAAAGAIMDRRRDVQFRLVGPLAGGHEAPWAQSVVDRAGRAGVRWSTVPDAQPELRDWDVFVLPSRRDPFPLVVLEAMAAGLPVVAAAVDGVPEQVDDTNGVLVAPDDAGALSAAIERLLDDEVERQMMGRRSAERVMHHFTPQRHADELASAYEHALGAAATRRHYCARA